ncbi:bifunctional glutamate N-acetyltransferase/amino-acid acetyltransferase ArgJ [Pseudomaricurvus alkylphenolicus]|uniref:bifunctional glutamate N-acetyltransferase/amino-acid acetyltransferase ArgJ n=1 Tax=Pseudomaricurvus alkylphenolicus TaxID=1306991 RepID=UPI00141DF09F|nr:bifunctional glutamate N-acetyltransferase/amino-acid acetyltransferase ArgJ [Pseudomaricurvus alkylphenolicus]NIB40049.1 bifunctional glutamate N-acetyltransferase/amino-acid acetyltransferase ArgJ [Pseudomaricurvus alkylphenolicus]
MAVGEFPFPTMHPVPGVKLGTASAGIKTPGRRDLVVLELAPGSRTSGVFTQNAFCAAPVTLCKRNLPSAETRYLLINSGNANACTGDEGLSDALSSCEELAKLAGGDVSAEQVLPFSTGVIGERLPMDRLLAALPEALQNLTADGWEAAAQGIMTTDTRPKGATVQFDHDGETVTVSGISKGSGMIKPNMATMLGYIATDAAVSQDLLNQLVKHAADASFNRITVDGDTSTNDSCMLVATGQSKLPEITDADSELYAKLTAAVTDIHIQLAQAIVTDGEGATKFVTIEVEAATSSEEAVKVAYSVAQSPLVKTALFASDPNWGRIVAAIGYAGVDGLDSDRIKVWLGDVLIVENGGRAPSYTEEAGQAVMNQENITIRIHLDRGDASDRVWTTDLSHDYVTINAEYRT